MELCEHTEQMEDDNSSQIAASGASLGTLPEEVILHIFSFLPPEDLMYGVRATCQLFYNLSLNPGLWKQVIVTRFTPDSPKEFEPIKSRYSSKRFYRQMLQQRCIGSGSNGSESGAGAKGNQHRWKKPARKLITSVEERGDIWRSCSVTGAMHYPNLERLTVVRDNLRSVEVLVKHQGLTHLQLCTSHLVDCNNRRNANGQLMIDLFENLKGVTNLQALTVRFSCLQCRTNIPSISDIQASMKDYFLTGPSLRQIDLSNFVNDEIFKAIFDKCSLLKDLAMSRPKLTPEAFCTAVSGQHQLLLSSLRIHRCKTLNDACLTALSVAFPNIKSLELSLTREITNAGLGHLLRACSELTKLDLKASSSGHKLLGGKTSDSLQFLGLFSMTFRSAWAFKKLCQYSSNLRKILLFRTNIGNTDMKTMAASCRLLEKAVVYECSGVDSRGVAFLMKNLPCLRKIVCKLSYPRLFQLEQLCPSRKRTRAGGLVLLNQPPTEDRLWSLGLYNCQELTAVGVSALAALYPNLRDLLIRTTNGLNDHTVKVILRSLPNLQRLRLDRSGETDRQNQLTGACLRHVQRWGTRLQRLELMARYRSFSIADLVRLLVHSSTLEQCVVPYNTEQSPDIPDREMDRMLNEQLGDQLQRQGKTVTHDVLRMPLDGVLMVFLGLCIFQD